MRRVALALAAIMAAGIFAGCSGSDGIDVTATFDDVGDLANGAPVTMADIAIGKVKFTRLAGNRAVVTMSLDPEAEVPQGVTARVRRTSVLGERIIDIVLPETLSDSTPLLQDGDHIDDTLVRSDLEDLVDEGSDVFGAISASQLAVMIEEGARGFGGSGIELGNLLQNYKSIVHAYAGRSKQISRLIGSLKNFNDTIAAEADAHARSIVLTERSLAVLDEESARLERAILSLNRLARGSRSILDAHLDEMGRFFSQSRTILGVLEDEQRSIRQLLKWAPGHNRNTQAVEYVDFNQVVQDFVICGFNDDPDNKARACKGGE